MKYFKSIIILGLVLFMSCQDDDVELDAITVPTNLSVNTAITTDGSGLVTFTATADHAITYKYVFSDGSSQVAPSGITSKRFTKAGLNTYTVTIIAYGMGGVSTSKLLDVTVESDFSDPDAVALLTGGGTKIWYWAADEPGHLGVGQNNDDASANYYPNYYQAAPFEKSSGVSSCMYEDRLIFTQEGETLKYTLDNGGQTFFNNAYQSVVGGSAGEDACYDYDTSGESTVILSPSESFVAGNDVPSQTRGTVMTFTEDNFMGYYIGQNSYEILSLTADRMVVRAVMGNDAGLAWYHTFTTTKPSQEEEEEETFDTLIWADEFETNGAPDTANWSYDLGTGQSGWGNNEAQYYTDRTDNIVVEDGVLKIIAKAESFSGSNYTSARIKTQDLFEFTYGRIEVNAKLPQGGGTWPAIWMLGADFAEVGWPDTGEIDIMEHVGNQQNTISSTLHFPGNSGGDGVSQSTEVSDASEAFHVYAAEWTATQIRFYVDDTLYHTFANTENIPFNHDFFIILNVAMGGNFGGTIDPAFTASTLEVDYVRVYQ